MLESIGRTRLVIAFLVLVFVLVPLLWYLAFGIGHASGHTGAAPIFIR